MADRPKLDKIAAGELHSRMAKQIVSQIVNEPIAAGGSISDVMVICESVLVGVVLDCFQPDSHMNALDLIVGGAKERLSKIRLDAPKTEGRGWELRRGFDEE